MISSVGTIKEEIAFRLNEAESDNTTVYLNWINLCLRDIQDSFPNAPFLRTSADQTLSSGTRIYTNPLSNYYRMNSVENPENQARLNFLMPEQFDIAVVSASESGPPRVYTIRGYGVSSRIEYYPTPATANTIHFDYQALIDTVSAGSAIPNIPVQYYELPCLYGEFRGLRRRGKYLESQQVQQEYESMKERMRQDLLMYTNELPRIKSDREFSRSNRVYDDAVRNMFWGKYLP